MKTIRNLAISRLRYQKSRSLLTAVAMILASTLLMTVGSVGVAILDINRQQVENLGFNHHARVANLTKEQTERLEQHEDVESITISEYVSDIVQGKLNASLSTSIVKKTGVWPGEYLEGRAPEEINEIASPPSLLEILGAEPKVGNTVSIPMRIGGAGKVVTKDFVISGVLKQREVEGIEADSARLVYGAIVSEKFADENLSGTDRRYSSTFRVNGQEVLNFDEIRQVIRDVAADIDLTEDDISYSNEYLYAMTSSGMETKIVIFCICVVVILFSSLVLYNIYYVSIVNSVQEIGKLRALGASKKQIRRLLFTEGYAVAGISIPVGIFAGYLFALGGIHVLFLMWDQPGLKANVFSLPVLVITILATFFTVTLALIKPSRMASKISPVEAMRYQDKSSSKLAHRKGRDHVSLRNLTFANLSRNRKRTITTILTMGLSCVLFLAVAGLMNSMTAENMARNTIPFGSFQIKLNYVLHDKEYPEKDLNMLQEKAYIGPEFQDRILEVEGVEEIRTKPLITARVDYPGSEYERMQVPYEEIGILTRENLQEFEQEHKSGTIDYDELKNNDGVIYMYDQAMEEVGLKLGDTFTLYIMDGQKEKDLQVTLMGTCMMAGDGSFYIPEDVIKGLNMDTDLTYALNIGIAEGQYDTIKKELKAITDESDRFLFYSWDEEIIIGKMAINAMKYPAYIVLAVIGVIGFMNLVNTMIVSVVTRKRELAVMQVIGLSNKQLRSMLIYEGLFFTTGTLICALTVGNGMGYFLYSWAKSMKWSGIQEFRYPIVETLLMMTVLFIGQWLIAVLTNRQIHREGLIERVRQSD